MKKVQSVFVCLFMYTCMFVWACKCGENKGKPWQSHFKDIWLDFLQAGTLPLWEVRHIKILYGPLVPLYHLPFYPHENISTYKKMLPLRIILDTPSFLFNLKKNIKKCQFLWKGIMFTVPYSRKQPQYLYTV